MSSSATSRVCEDIIKFDQINDPTFFQVFSFMATNNFSDYLYFKGLLGDFSGVCSKCNIGEVTKKYDGKSRNGENTYFWRCNYHKCRKKIGLKRGSFFERSQLSCQDVFILVCGFVYKFPQYTIRQTYKKFASHTLVDWYNFCRDVCSDILLIDNKKIGGPGHVVEIDESKFGKQKYGRGDPVDGVWVFGGIDRQTRETFFQVVEHRSAATLIPILVEFVHPETTIISDCWKAYKDIKNQFFQHLTVNHSLHFVNPDDRSVHTNSIES
ncbi:uncharacterized protein [Palaemon carinicauda]|uniref:uncharacterized protein n=1 Tax=Palaemon carinicauda TaxID=392227 RepID=UPI0035B63EDA